MTDGAAAFAGDSVLFDCGWDSKEMFVACDLKLTSKYNEAALHTPALPAELAPANLNLHFKAATLHDDLSWTSMRLQLECIGSEDEDEAKQDVSASLGAGAVDMWRLSPRTSDSHHPGVPYRVCIVGCLCSPQRA